MGIFKEKKLLFICLTCIVSISEKQNHKISDKGVSNSKEISVVQGYTSETQKKRTVLRNSY